MGNFGYACINMTLGKKDVTTNRTMIRKTFDARGIKYASELALKNCQDLIKILIWNKENNISFFRLTSNLFPWGSEYELETLPDYEEISKSLYSAGLFAKNNGIRITSHPGPFNKLCSSDNSVLCNTITDLKIHGQVFDMMGLERTPYAKINIHVGASYGNREATADVFCRNFDLLPESVRTRLTVENDDKESLFSTKQLYDLIYKNTEIPIVHDQHHHTFCNSGQSQKEAMHIAYETWKNVKPVIHYSESKSEESGDSRIKPQAHSDFVLRKIDTFGLDVDVMIEAKFKELALKKYLELHEK